MLTSQKIKMAFTYVKKRHLDFLDLNTANILNFNDWQQKIGNKSDLKLMWIPSHWWETGR
jgi:hypothetical protein